MYRLCGTPLRRKVSVGSSPKLRSEKMKCSGGPDVTSSVLLGLSAPSNSASFATIRPLSMNDAKRQLDTKCLLDFGDQPRRQQRMTAHIKEIGADIGDGHAQQVSPQRGKARFGVVARRLGCRRGRFPAATVRAARLCRASRSRSSGARSDARTRWGPCIRAGGDVANHVPQRRSGAPARRRCRRPTAVRRWAPRERPPRRIPDLGCSHRVDSISPGSMRKPRILSWSS